MGAAPVANSLAAVGLDRNLRLRLGRAIDELGRDESRTLGLIDELHRRLADIRARVQSAEAPLTRTLSELRAEEQEVFLLRQNGEMTYEEIAEALGVPSGTVKTRMRLALSKLREVLAE